ncbi:MAG: YihA family ribosome biogenesis GTP-binding protein [Opitutaceae bacterium]|nr:YihA family ribosome biogenesis GTP-binding protein [Opitutaceae bacterium]
MKITSSEFKTSAPDVASCPNWTVPEFAFVGRSNVGKSSLINMLVHRRDLAKVSATPGKTRLLNFFHINGEWGLVDLPGYGYAKVGKGQRLEIGQMIARFVAERGNLRCVFVLIDCRLPPQPIDLEFLQWLETTTVPFALIFTKTDKLGPMRLKANIEDYKKTLRQGRAVLPDILTSSSHDGSGRADILNYIATRLETSAAPGA